MSTGNKNIPGPGLFSFIKNVRDNPVLYFYALMKEYGGIVRCRSLPDIYLVSNPVLARKILIDPQKFFDKTDVISTRMKKVMGEGLVVSNGRKWKRQRKTAQLIIGKEHLQKLVPGIVSRVDDMMAAWKTKAGSGQPVNVSRDARSLVIKIMAESMFPLKNEETLRRLEKDFFTGKEYVSSPMPFGLPGWVPLSRKSKMNRALKDIDRVITKMMDERPLTGKYEGKLMTHIMDQCDEDGNRLTRKEIVAEVKNLFASSYFSISDFIAWLVYSLAKYPRWADKIAVECLRVNANPGPGCFEQAAGMMKFIHEVLRCYPPGWAVSRRTLSPVDLGRYRIPRHATILVSIYNLHHDPDSWDDPETFDPGRFDRLKEITEKAVFMPFGLGPRKCAGMALANMVINIVCAKVVSHFRLRVNEAVAPVIQSGISLGAGTDIEVFIENR